MNRPRNKVTMKREMKNIEAAAMEKHETDKNEEERSTTHTTLTHYSRDDRVERLLNLQELLFELSIVVIVAGCFLFLACSRKVLRQHSVDL